eukprot:scaffold54585_cov71-Phaeocystis_antarctica.AAC.5
MSSCGRTRPPLSPTGTAHWGQSPNSPSRSWQHNPRRRARAPGRHDSLRGARGITVLIWCVHKFCKQY